MNTEPGANLQPAEEASDLASEQRQHRPWFAPALLQQPTARTNDARCPICLENIPVAADPCPECGESTEAAVSSLGSPSIADDAPDASWLTMHWRPLVILGAVGTLLCSGVALRYLAPGRFAPSWAASAQTPPMPTCATPCWSGESCQLGRCVWQQPNNVGHVAKPSVAGPFALSKDVSDVLMLDADRFAAALLLGTQILDASTGQVISLVSEAPQSRRLFSVGDAIYATAPQRIYVIDADSTRLLKTIELGATVGEVTVGALGRRVLASLPTAHAVVVIATEYDAEIDRIQFGDDPVGPVGIDDTGSRALTTTGQIPLPGLRNPTEGAGYAFDPGRLGTEQDRVRTSMPGNPVSVLITPDGQHSLIALRGENALLPLTWLESGAVRQGEWIATCKEPEQVELIRDSRRAIVRCNEGRAVQVFDLKTSELLRTISLQGRATDMALSPDGTQAVVSTVGDGVGGIALVNLKTYAATTVSLNGEPTRVRLSPDGRVALALSDRAKVAWVVR